MSFAPSHFPSPNFTERRGGARPSLIVIHYTAMESAAAAHARLCDPVAEVSAHWLISETGTADALVPEAARAWHAGQSHWRGLSDVNSHSIGIELANRGTHPFPEPQMVALEGLLRAIMARWQIAPAGVLAHSDVAPERKIDPGARFDWARLARQGLALDAGPDLAPEGDFHSLARAIGYDPAASDTAILRAFRLRHRPWGQGPLHAQDLARMQAVAAAAARLPVDAAPARA